MHPKPTAKEIEACEYICSLDDDDFYETVEQLDELSKATLGSYIRKASKEIATGSPAMNRKNSYGSICMV